MHARHPRKELPALILGTGITVLGTIRSLEKVGITAYCLSSHPALEASSRWYRPMPLPYGTISEGTSLEKYLEALPFERAVLIPCSDSWTRSVAALPERLKERFPSGRPSADTQELFIDKGRFERTLEACKIPHPKTYLLHSDADMAALANEPLDGYFLKPRDSQGFFQRFQVKGFSVNSAEDCLARFRQIRSAGFEVMLQEYIPGPASNHYYVEGFFDRTGKLSCAFARQRLRMYPSDFGNSTFMVSVALEEVQQALDDISRLMRTLNFRGIFSAEFKKDARNGVFKLIEVNIRPWWYIEFATNCGVNVGEMAYFDALDLEIPVPGQYRIGATSVNFYTDWQVWLSGLLTGDSFGVRECARAWLFGYHTVLSYSDPLPAVRWLDGLVRQKLKSAFFGPFERVLRRRAPLGRSVPS